MSGEAVVTGPDLEIEVSAAPAATVHLTAGPLHRSCARRSSFVIFTGILVLLVSGIYVDYNDAIHNFWAKCRRSRPHLDSVAHEIRTSTDMSPTVAATATEDWDALFRPLCAYDPSLYLVNDESSPSFSLDEIHHEGGFDFLYYHVRKAGGSSLYNMFERANIQNYHNRHNPGYAGCCGQELPGYFNEFIAWRDRGKRSRHGTRRLVIMSFREPIERAVSHYFYTKPCPDGSGGGYNERCREASRRGGFDAFLDVCDFARNWQIRYLDNNATRVGQLDFVLPVDRMDEAIVLFAAKFGVPIYQLFYTTKKVKVKWPNMVTHAANISDEGEGNQSLSCTEQWLIKLVPAEKLRAFNETCSQACAGKVGLLSLSDGQLDRVRRINSNDILLWGEVNRRYNEEKLEILQRYVITDAVLQSAVSNYREARLRYERFFADGMASP